MLETTQTTSKHLQQPIKAINPNGLFDPMPYGFSHAIVTKGIQDMVFIAGQGGEDQNGVLKQSFEAQVKQAYKNLLTVIESSGAKPAQVTKLTTYVADYDQTKLDVMTKALTSIFGDHRPAQTLVPVPRLALDGMLFEVDAVAVLTE